MPSILMKISAAPLIIDNEIWRTPSVRAAVEDPFGGGFALKSMDSALSPRSSVKYLNSPRVSICEYVG